MSDFLQRGLGAVGRRTDALGGEHENNGSSSTVIRGDRHEILRRIVSGFIPVDETDQAIALVEAVGSQIIEMLGQTETVATAEFTEDEMASLLASAQSACAQMLAVGGATQMAVDGRLA